MSKVVLLAINAKYVHSSLSVWVIAEGIARFSHFSHDVSVIEANINQKCSDIVDSVVEHEPDIIGISSYIWNAGMLPGLLEMLREKLPEVVLVLGGPEASHNAEYWLKNGADYVLQGEGEYEFPKFLDSRQGDFLQGVQRSALCSSSVLLLDSMLNYFRVYIMPHTCGCRLHNKTDELHSALRCTPCKKSPCLTLDIVVAFN